MKSCRFGSCVSVCVITLLSATQLVIAADGVETSVVKILVTKREPDLTRPWTKEAPEKASGSGVVIEGNRVLTNAHVVEQADRIEVILFGNERKSYRAIRVGTDPLTDSALIRIEEPKDAPLDVFQRSAAAPRKD